MKLKKAEAAAVKTLKEDLLDEVGNVIIEDITELDFKELAKIKKQELDDIKKKLNASQKQYAKFANLGKILYQTIPLNLQKDEEKFKKALNYAKEVLEVFGTLDGDIPDGILPKYDENNVLMKYPIIISLDVSEMAKKVGNTSFQEFVKRALDKFEPVIQKTIKARFEEQYKELPASLLDKIVRNKKTDFLHKIVKVEKDHVELIDIEMDDVDNSVDITGVDPEIVAANIFRDEFILHS